MTETGSRLLYEITCDDPPPAFALVYRPHSSHGGVEVIVGEMSHAATTADIPLPALGPSVDRHDTLTILPYRQLAERGQACRDDGAPLLVMTIHAQAVATVAEVTRRITDVGVGLRGGGFDLDDLRYAEGVRRIQRDEIGTGAGSNFVLKRSYSTQLENWSTRCALSLFRRLLGGEYGSHWIFLIHTGERTLLGASPERHISVQSGLAVMNPISGTYRYPPSGPTEDELLRFLADGKEANELYMVVDEELKMMSRICPHGGWIRGPYLHEMTHLAHTGYLVEGHTDLDVRRILRETMFAPTVVGSPVVSACQVVARYEPRGRSYYGGVAALIGRDRHGARCLDSAILIRTAEIDPAGRLRLDVGATLMRDSDPDREAAETTAKAAGVLAALQSTPTHRSTPLLRRARMGERVDIQRALARRNATLAPFWRQQPDIRGQDRAALRRQRVLIIDADDAFTHMGKTLLSALGLAVDVRRFDDEWNLHDFHAVVIGPGPGDPRQHDQPKIRRLRLLARTLLDEKIPFLAICLGHQVLCAELGLLLVRKRVPDQGIQRSVAIFGRTELAYFYNTFAAVHHADQFEPAAGIGPIEVYRDRETGEIHALRTREFASLQFHPASVMTPNGITIVGEVLSAIMNRAIDPSLSV